MNDLKKLENDIFDINLSYIVLEENFKEVDLEWQTIKQSIQV